MANDELLTEFKKNNKYTYILEQYTFECPQTYGNI